MTGSADAKPQPTRTAADLLREAAARDPEAHKAALGRGYGLGPAVGGGDEAAEAATQYFGGGGTNVVDTTYECGCKVGRSMLTGAAFAELCDEHRDGPAVGGGDEAAPPEAAAMQEAVAVALVPVLRRALGWWVGQLTEGQCARLDASTAREAGGIIAALWPLVRERERAAAEQARRDEREKIADEIAAYETVPTNGPWMVDKARLAADVRTGWVG